MDLKEKCAKGYYLETCEIECLFDQEKRKPSQSSIISYSPCRENAICGVVKIEGVLRKHPIVSYHFVRDEENEWQGESYNKGDFIRSNKKINPRLSLNILSLIHI